MLQFLLLQLGLQDMAPGKPATKVHVWDQQGKQINTNKNATCFICELSICVISSVIWAAENILSGCTLMHFGMQEYNASHFHA